MQQSDTPWAIILPFSWNAGSCLAAPFEALVDKSTVTTMTLKIWVHNENSDFMSRKKGWWLETASYCSWDCSFFDIIASVLYRVVHLRLSISKCQQKWFSKSSILYISHWTYWVWLSCFTTRDPKPMAKVIFQTIVSKLRQLSTDDFTVANLKLIS